MALITCPECGKEVSDSAGACPNCGYPLKGNDLTSDGDKKKNPATLLIAMVLVIAVAVALYFYTSSFLAEHSPKGDAYHTVLGHSISVGMSKTEVDEMLGAPRSGSSDLFFYADELTISYRDGKIYYISIHDTKWETAKGVTTRDTVSDVMKVYGDTELTDVATLGGNVDFGKGYIFDYYLDKNGAICDLLHAYRHISFHVGEDGETINTIMIDKGIADK